MSGAPTTASLPGRSAHAGTARPLNWAARGNDTKGYLRPSILYHLRTIGGSATARRLEALIGTHVSSINVQLSKMVADGLLASSTPVKVPAFALTALGQAEAATVRRERVEFA